MTAAAPYLMGYAVTASAAFSINATITTALQNPGDAVVVCGFTNSGTLSGVTDTEGNSYISEVNENTDFSVSEYLCAAPVTITTSDTVTLSGSGSGELGVAVIGIPGYQSVSAIGTEASSSTASPSVSTSSSAAANSAVVAIIAGSNAAVSFAWNTPFSQLFSGPHSQPNGPFLNVACYQTTASGIVTASGTQTAGKTGGAILAMVQNSGSSPPFALGIV